VQIEDLVKVSADGEILDGQRTPTSEKPMHIGVYAALPGAGAVIHAHAPAATGFALAGQAIDTSASSEAYFILGPEVPLIPYARPSTQGLADVVRQAVNPRIKAYLLANHGVLTWGCDLSEAYDVLDTLEMFAQSQVAATLLGGPVPLPRNELDWLEHKVMV
jgi:L-fuculose-phosphate aldolase